MLSMTEYSTLISLSRNFLSLMEAMDSLLFPSLDSIVSQLSPVHTLRSCLR